MTTSGMRFANRDLLDANYRRGSVHGHTVQPGVSAGVCSVQPWRAWVAVPSCCIGWPTRARALCQDRGDVDPASPSASGLGLGFPFSREGGNQQRALRPALDSHLTRQRQVTRALRLVSVSVVFGVASGTVSVITGLHGHSLGVFAVGLGVLADVTGSATLIWRFRAERYRPGQSAAHEWRAAVIVAVTLAAVTVVLTAESVSTLASGSRPGTAAITLIAAGVSFAVLTPLAFAKRRLGRQMGSRALQGDGTLSGIGAATSLLALAALALNSTLGWWWADRVAALIVAAVAAVEAWHTAPHYRRPGEMDRYALGGTRTLGLLIRRLCHAHWLPAHSGADLPEGHSLMRNTRRL